MSKTVTARLYIGGESVGKVTYETRKDSKYGSQIARLVLDEFAQFTKTVAERVDESWAVTYTDGESEFAYVGTNNEDEMEIEINGDVVEVMPTRTIRGTEAMWDWLRERGWY